MGEVCEICGVAGWTDLLLTCTQCKKSHMHVYCLRIPLDEPIDDWVCEECESTFVQEAPTSTLERDLPGVSKLTNSNEVHNDGEQRAESSKLPKESKKGPLCLEKKVARRKTQIIPILDAIKLSSRDIKSKNSSKVALRSKPPRCNVGVCLSDQTPSRPTPVPLSSSPREDLALGHLRQPKTRVHGSNVGSPKGKPQQLKKPTDSSEVQRLGCKFQPSEVPMDKHPNEQPTKIPLPCAKVKSALKKPLLASTQKAPTITIPGDGGHSTIESRNRNAKNTSNNSLLDLDKCSRTPALDALWMGQFSIVDNNHRCYELNYNFQAHPPSHVHQKSYEILKQLPEVLHFQLVPSQKFSTNFFNGQQPDERDIGLYVFPSDSERSVDYIFLVGVLGLKNLALRKQIAGVELLVFTSKLLPVNCQIWKGNYFLWGVFHKLKQALPDNGPPKLSVQPSLSSPMTVVSPPDVKHEDNDHIPPGFEEVYRLKFGSISSAQNVVPPERKRKEPDDHDSPRSFHAKFKSKYLRLT